MTIEQAEQEGREGRGFVRNTVTHMEQQGEPLRSIRMYTPLNDVNVGALNHLRTANKDDDHGVVLPVGGLLHMGNFTDDGQMIIDDIVAVPNMAVTMGHDQIPVMVDQKPSFEKDPYNHSGEGYHFGRLPMMFDLNQSVKADVTKEKEQVLAIPAANFIEAMGNSASNEYNGVSILNDEFYQSMHFLRRGWCEKDERFIQLLPYMVFFKIIDGEYHIFVYQRGKGVGEERLAGGCSIGVGGHVNPQDMFSFSMVPDANGVMQNKHRLLVNGFWDTIYSNMYRESQEEVTVTNHAGDVLNVIAHNEAAHRSLTNEWNGWVYRNAVFFLDYAAGAVEKVHLGMFVGVQLPETFEVRTNEDELHDVGFVKLSDLAKGEGVPSELECWSKSIIDSLASTKDFVEKEGVEMVSSGFMRDSAYYNCEHFVEPEVVAKIPMADRWKIGTLSGIFHQHYQFYSMNAFMKV